jgi:hypothetical protein
LESEQVRWFAGLLVCWSTAVCRDSQQYPVLGT